MNITGNDMHAVVSELKTEGYWKITQFRLLKSSCKQTLPSWFIFLNFNRNKYTFYIKL